MRAVSISLFLFFLVIIQVTYAQSLREVKEFYSAGDSVLKERYFLQGPKNQLNGLYESFFLSGVSKQKGYFKNGSADSLWIFYYESGLLKQKGNFSNGKKNGNWKFFYETGAEKYSGSYKNDLKEGSWYYYFENGELKLNAFYNEGKPDSIWKYYYESGALKAKAYHNPDSAGVLYESFYPTGNLKSRGKLFNGKSEGLWTYYRSDGSIRAQGFEKEGKRNGVWNFYYRSGKMSSEGSFYKGLKTGKWNYYHENGELESEGNVVKGLRDGYWKIYNPSGFLKGEANLNMGDGDYTEYYESGQVKIKGEFEDDKRNGSWKYFYKSGQLEGRCNYQNDTGSFVGFYKSGAKKMEGEVIGGEKRGVWSLYHENGNLAGYYKTVSQAIVGEGINKEDTVSGKEIDPENFRELKRSKKLRYFKKVRNEYETIIISAAPLSVFVNALPIAVEYYMEERMGYELSYAYIRDPIFTPRPNVESEEFFESGFYADVKQKFYQQERNYGMIYFAHSFRYTSTEITADVLNNPSDPGQGVTNYTMDGYSVQYSITFGDRFMRSVEEPGITADFFMGLGIGYQDYTSDFAENQRAQSVFDGKISQGIFVPIRFGINVGYMF